MITSTVDNLEYLKTNLKKNIKKYVIKEKI